MLFSKISFMIKRNKILPQCCFIPGSLHDHILSHKGRSQAQVKQLGDPGFWSEQPTQGTHPCQNTAGAALSMQDQTTP